MKDKALKDQAEPAKPESREDLLSPAWFVTICTQEKELYFGEVVKGKMHLSEIGELAARYWKEIPKHYPYATLDAFVVMPNHVHGIVSISKPGNQKEILSTIMGSYKAVVLNSAKMIARKFAWQAKLHAQLIKDKTNHANIAEYIANNPSKWRHDKFYKS